MKIGGRDRRLTEMLALGMQAEGRAFLVVMRWPEPFTALPWREPQAGLASPQLTLEEALRDALPSPETARETVR